MAPPESGISCVIHRRMDEGLESEVGGKRGKDIYYMGIIDILQVGHSDESRFPLLVMSNRPP